MSRIVFHSSDRPLLSFFHHLRQSYFVSVLIIYFCLNFGPGLDVLWVLFLNSLSSYISLLSVDVFGLKDQTVDHQLFLGLSDP